MMCPRALVRRASAGEMRERELRLAGVEGVRIDHWLDGHR